MKDYVIKNVSPKADPRSIVQGDKYRFTVLTDKMIRMEYSESGHFVDEMTETVINRLFPVPEFTVKDSSEKIEIVTSKMVLSYNKEEFSPRGLQIRMLGNRWLMKQETWFFGDKDFEGQGNLGGTYYNLDGCDGDVHRGRPGVGAQEPKKISLGHGLMAQTGFSVIDDSNAPSLDEHGWPIVNEEKHYDVYFLNYGRDYLGLLKDFYHLSGKTPMIPRFALGNWWSRYYSYTQDEYIALMDKFEDKGIPFAVSVFDMGWHLVNIDPKYGKGWTGYTWNTDLLPDPKGLLKNMHDRGKHVTLNVHPADGIRAHESMYKDMAEAMGIDPASELPVEFDVTSKDFWKAYFNIVHHPMEDEGVDFWWLDWQQGENTRAAGFDPLWMLNQYHYLDNARGGKRGMTFSRYGGLGSHRYPIGFSGSTSITWNSLNFQPYFTATASNVGYGWWSHDIGGHRGGISDDELVTRWVQYGVFSPIMRMHSSNDNFNAKEPWKYCRDSEEAMTAFLRLRHRLVPYTYTMNYRAWHDDRPLVEPMYYVYPESPDAYAVKNQYMFGSQLMVNPITSKKDPETLAGCAKTWLPDGLWYDIFTGISYKGGRMMNMHRSLESIPVFAKAGGILPMAEEKTIGCDVSNPAALEVCVFVGADGSFELYEDDGVTEAYREGKSAITRFAVHWGEEKSFVIEPVHGCTELVPAQREYSISFYGLQPGNVTGVAVNGAAREFAGEYDETRNVQTVHIGAVAPTDRVVFIVADDAVVAENPVSHWAYTAIRRAEIDYATKESLYKTVIGKADILSKLSAINSMPLSDEMKSVVYELLLAK